MSLALETPRTVAQQPATLVQAVLRTLAYSDIFDFPLTVDEIARYLIGYRTTADEVRAALAQLGAAVSCEGERYALAGHEALFALRRQRAAHAAALWRPALRYGRLIAGLPFVRMVAVTGALAADNVAVGADIDYLIVTKPGWLWLCRAMALAVNRVARLAGLSAELCPNYLLSENALALQDVDLFTAQELARMLPLSGLDVYEAMRAANAWSNSFLPMASGVPRLLPGAAAGSSWLQRAAEFVLGLLPFGWLEGWEMRRKIAKFTRQQAPNAETRFSADFCKGHFDGHKAQTLRAFEQRLAALEPRL
jgi:hypothetical protein